MGFSEEGTLYLQSRVEIRTVQSVASRALPATHNFCTNIYFMFKKFLGRLPLSLLLIFFFNFKCTGIFLVDAFLFLNSSILLWVNNRKIKLSFPHLLSFLLLHMLSDPAQMEYTLRLAH